MKRREFIRNMGLLGGSMALGLNGIPLKAFSSPLLLNIEQTNGKILVLLQMNGGNDGLNTLIPYEDDLYYNKRPQIGIKKQDVVALNEFTGLNPAMAGFRNLYEDGKLGIVQNVGYENHNRSHFRSTDIWLSGSDADQNLYDGWVGRSLSYMYPDFETDIPEHPMAIQLGAVESMLLQSPIGSMSVVFENPNTFYQMVSGSIADDDPPESTLAGTELAFLRKISSQSTNYASVVKEKADKGKNTVTYPNTSIGKQLAIVASLIAGGLETPVYLTTISGFDTHANQLTAHAKTLTQLSEAITAFQSDLETTGMADRVVLMTFSEFGRRVEENGSRGTDHGTAAPLFVIGKSVSGGIIGGNPNLVNLDKNGDLLHQYDYRQIYTTILQDHLGLNKAKTEAILGKSYEKLNLFHKSAETGFSFAPLQLNKVYPNPFQYSAAFEYELKRSIHIRLSIFDLQGREVAVIYDGLQNAGRHSQHFSNRLATGTYIALLSGEGRQSSKKVVVV
ncbi:DUF1501 domain-containing protein [Pontibacter cellulosilyticus]|uniref:DUF1501 domain-containing protein n=1 Tax=Pontibacter cellulosilyticus TaxID=1720253 RepID=A0A923NA86_9BACT|nr:DUF1501 domain-containing protein [Pontibacter cellulosilyticus]MBC5994529.1 DUF1501 domain-containing protein [Pontibacter cellulosilyticus]